MTDTPSLKYWHTLTPEQTLQELGTTESGLSQAQAEERLRRFGPNKLPEQRPPTPLQIFFRQFNNPLIYVLLAAAVVAIGIGDFKDAAFIAIVLLLNAGIGAYQEWRAEQSSRALQKLLNVRATLLRDDEVIEVDAEQVVPGDVLYLESGNRIPADLRLLSAHSLQVDESFLTGESLAVGKEPQWLGEPTTPVADRRSLCFAGAVVARGRGKGVVVATGTETAVGQLAEAVAAADVGTAPLIERMHGLARLVALVVLIIATVIGLGGVLIHGTGQITEIFLFTVALAVAAIPEGLPAALTVALAIATSRMARRGVIVRRLAAVEGLGSCTLVASDKTGTLTCNELTARLIQLPGRAPLSVTGEGFTPAGDIRSGDQPTTADQDTDLHRLIETAVLCNEGDLHRHQDGWNWRGDPTDIALLALGYKAHKTRETLLDAYPQVNAIPFEAEHRFSATFHQAQDGPQRVFVKGAPERILAMCQLASDEQQTIRDQMDTLGRQGYRVLAFASGALRTPVSAESSPPDPSELAFLGLVGMIDPLRPGVQDAVAACHQAGIKVSMITGDHPITAAAIGRQLGIANDDDRAITGQDLESMSEDELGAAVETCRVFARVAPTQKLQIVQAAQRRGHFVAVTGDGVNDAPALRTANIGVAMGKSGTDVAREAAELVISDDDFSTIVKGIEEGRVAYDNVRKVIAQLVATGAAEVMLVCMALAAGGLIMLTSTATEAGGVLLPLLPVQLLWLNLVTNGIQGVAMAFEPSEGDVLKRKPRPPQQPIFNRLMVERTLVAAGVMAAVGITVFLVTRQLGWTIEQSRNALLLLMVLFENIHVGNNRSETKSAFSLSPLRSPYLLAGVMGAFGIHLLAMYFPPLQAVLQTEPVSWQTWLVLLSCALSVLIAMEIHKWSWARRFGRPNG